MTDITITRRRKKVYVVKKDLKPASAVSGKATTVTKGKKTLSLKSKPKAKAKPKKVKTPPPQPKPAPVTPPKRIKPPAIPQVLKPKQIARVLRLCEHLPTVFSVDSPRPLAIGITDELVALMPEGLSKRTIQGGVKCYTKLPRYQQAIKRGDKRINAKGHETETPSAEHIEHANKQLARWQALKEKWPDLYAKAVEAHPALFAD